MNDPRGEQIARRVSALSVCLVLVGVVVLAAVLWQGLSVQRNLRENAMLDRKLVGLDQSLLAGLTATTPNDSPVTVRGGSVVIRGTSWTCPQDYNHCVTTLSEPATLVSLDGVDPRGNGDGYTTPQLIPENIGTNWKITFSFRADKTKDDPKKLLTLCTSDPTCSSTSGSVQSNLYLVGDGNGKASRVTRDRDGIRYDLTAPCGTVAHPTHGSDCNHIHTLTVFTASSPGGTPYHCVDGECSVSIGK